MKNNKLNSSFCVLPWVHLATNSSGYLRLCCNSTPGKNILTNESGKKLKLTDSYTYDDIKNNYTLKNIRKKMLSGKDVEVCQRCYREEACNVKSARMGWNEKYSDKINKILSSTMSSGETNYYAPLYVDLRLGNLCNLKCRMCNPYASRKWTEDWSEVEKNFTLKEKEYLKNLNWFENEKTWEFLKSITKDTEEIYFTGGEPFLITKHVKLLDYLIENNRSEDVILKYNTNLTVLPEKVISRWSNFKKVKVNVSIDGVKEVNEYIRNPSSWSNISKNLIQLDQMCSENTNLLVNIHSTVQVYNINKLDEIINFMFKFENFTRVPYFNILNHPEYLNIRVIKKENKVKISNELKSRIDTFHKLKLTDSELLNLNKLSAVIDYMNKEDWNDKYKRKFLDYTKKIDIKRSEDIMTVNPYIFNSIV